MNKKGPNKTVKNKQEIHLNGLMIVFSPNSVQILIPARVGMIQVVVKSVLFIVILVIVLGGVKIPKGKDSRDNGLVIAA